MNPRRALTLVGLALLLSPLLGAPFAAAEGLLVASDPAPRAEVDRRPGWVTLVFSTQVDESVAKVVVFDEAGKNVTINRLIVEGGNNVTTQLADGLPKGTYTVLYRINKGNDDVQGGQFQFAYGKGHWTKPTSTWSGAKNEPAVMRVNKPNPDEKETSNPTASSNPPDVEVDDGKGGTKTIVVTPYSSPTSASPSATATATSAEASTTPDQTQTQAPSTAQATPTGGEGTTGGRSVIGWVVAGVLAAAAAGVLAVVARGRRVKGGAGPG